jgi:hypothetical protein
MRVAIRKEVPTFGKSAARRDIVTVSSEPLPEDRTDLYYIGLPEEELLREIKQGIEHITASRNQMNKEMRKRLLPAFIELKKRTFRKHPGYYEILAAMGLKGATVRQWFHRSHTADEVIGLTEEEEEKTQPEPRKGEEERSLDTEGLLLDHADKLARAILEDKIPYAKKLATQYVETRNERLIADVSGFRVLAPQGSRGLWSSSSLTYEECGDAAQDRRTPPSR